MVEGLTGEKINKLIRKQEDEN